jgi:hypothetical protein
MKYLRKNNEVTNNQTIFIFQTLILKLLVFFTLVQKLFPFNVDRVRRDRDRMVVGFTTTCAISTYPTNVVSSTLLMSRCTRYNIM